MTCLPSTVAPHYNVKSREGCIKSKSRHESYQEWLSQPPIQFPLHPHSLIRNDYNNNSSSQVGNGGNQIEVGMNDYVWDMIAMEIMMLDEF